MKGMFITFEGIDGCGKSTQIELFHKKLLEDGYDVELLREAGGTIISEKIRQIILDKKNSSISIKTELLLFEAARAQIVNEIIKPLLTEGKIVICDRFIDSSVAYQGYGRELGFNIVDELNKFAIEETYPDITYLFDLDPKTASSRLSTRKKENDRLDNESMDFISKVRQGYLEIADRNSDRIKVLDANKNISELSLEVYKIFKEEM